MPRKQWTALLGVISLITILAILTFGRDRNASGAYITAPVERRSVSNRVNANGTLEAVRTVQIGSQISGQIAGLYADYNSKVKRGQILATIDPRTFQTQVATERAQVASNSARVEAAKADVVNQEASIVQSEANLRAAQSSSQNAAVQFERAKELNDKGLISKNDYDAAKTNADTEQAKLAQASAAVDQAKAAIRSKNAQVLQAQADVAGARAGLDRAAISLELTKVYSPVDGVVISRNVDVGQTVAASLQAPTLFVIANDLSQMQVKASIDEADIGKISQDAAVEFTVDAYPEDVFHGLISEIRLEPQTVQNVVTYNVIVKVANTDLKLKPGMTANLTITVDTRENVLTIPNAALRFIPEGVTAKEKSATNKSTTVWVLDEHGKPQAKRVDVGISDGSRTEVRTAELREGDHVIIGNKSANEKKTTTSGAPPMGMPFGMRGGGGGRGGRGGN